MWMLIYCYDCNGIRLQLDEHIHCGRCHSEFVQVVHSSNNNNEIPNLEVEVNLLGSAGSLDSAISSTSSEESNEVDDSDSTDEDSLDEHDDDDDDDDDSSSSGSEDSHRMRRSTISPPRFKATSELIRTNASCTICLEKYRIGDDCTTLPCFHVFHSQCLTGWLSREGICPVCRTHIESEATE